MDLVEKMLCVCVCVGVGVGVGVWFYAHQACFSRSPVGHYMSVSFPM